MGIRCVRDTLAHVKIGDHADLRLTTFSVRVGFRLDAAVGAGETHTILGKGALNATTPANYWLGIKSTGELYGGFVDTGNTNRTVTSPATITVGRWYSAMLTWEESPVGNLYLHCYAHEYRGEAGAAQTTVASNPAPIPTVHTGTEDLYFGCGMNSALGNGGDISISEVWISSAEESYATFISRCTARVTGYEANLVGYWRCDEGEGAGMGGSTVYDRCDGNAPTVKWEMHSADSWGSPDVSEDVTWHPERIHHVLARPWQYRYARLSLTHSSGLDGTIYNHAQWTDDPTDLHYPVGICTASMPLLGWLSATKRRGVTVTASEEATGYEDDYLLCARKAKPWRSSDASGAKTIVFDLGSSPPPAWVVSIAGHNLASAGSDGYIEAGTADAWTCFEGGFPALDVNLGVVDPSTAVVLPHGMRIKRSLTKAPLLSFEWPMLADYVARELRRLMRETGGAGYVWVCPDPARRLYELGVYGIIQQLPGESVADPSWTYVDAGQLVVMGDVK